MQILKKFFFQEVIEVKEVITPSFSLPSPHKV